MRIKSIVLSLLSISLTAGSLWAAHYKIDPMHSEISFRIKHMMVSKVSGKFDKFSGEFDYDEKNPKSWNAQATIDPASINTGVDARDKHLKGAEFFDVEKLPSMGFKSTGVEDLGGGKAKLMGLLSMHGVEKPVTLDLEVGGTAPDMKGGTRAGFEANGKLNRKDFGISWDKMPGALGDDVEIRISVEGVSDAPKMDSKPAEIKKSPEKK